MEPLAPQEQPTVEKATLHEADVLRVKTELDAQMEGGEAGDPQIGEIRKALVATLPTHTPTPAPTGIPSAPSIDAVTEAKVIQLTQKALEDGILAAHSAARKEEPYVLDALHDVLAGKLYEELQRRGAL